MKFWIDWDNKCVCVSVCIFGIFIYKASVKIAIFIVIIIMDQRFCSHTMVSFLKSVKDLFLKIYKRFIVFLKQ